MGDAGVRETAAVTADEDDPTSLVGCHVVEVGVRQAWPFLTFADPTSGTELRLFIDAPVRVTPDGVPLRQDDERVLSALERVSMLTVDEVTTSDGHLLLRLEDQLVWISGTGNELTTGEAWRLRLQQPPALTEGARAQQRLDQLLRPDAAPAGFTYPSEFLRAVRLGLSDLEPWSLLFGRELHRRSRGLDERYPETLVPFAARIDNDDVACWDLALPAGRVLVVHDLASPGWERRAEFASFGGWLRQAVDDCIELGELESGWSR